MRPGLAKVYLGLPQARMDPLREASLCAHDDVHDFENVAVYHREQP